MAMQLLFFKWQAVFWKQDYFLQPAWAAGQFRSDFENCCSLRVCVPTNCIVRPSLTHPSYNDAKPLHLPSIQTKQINERKKKEERNKCKIEIK